MTPAAAERPYVLTALSKAPGPDDPVDRVAKCGHVHWTKAGGYACRGHSKRSRKCCGKPPAKGHRVCVLHGARSPQAKAGASRRLALAAAEAELVRLGGRVDVEPADAMLAMVQEAAWNVAVYRRLVQTLELQTTATGGALKGDLDEDDEPVQIDPRVLAAGLASRVSPDDWRAAPHVWVTMYDAEREKLVRWAKACRDAGVDEQRMRLLEGQAEQLVGLAHDIAAGLLEQLVAAGVEAGLVRRVAEASLPGVMRRAFERAHALELQEVNDA